MSVRRCWPLPNVAGVLAVSGRGVRAEHLVLHHLRKAEDSVERRAQLMAHGGEEAGFRQVDFLGRRRALRRNWPSPARVRRTEHPFRPARRSWSKRLNRAGWRERRRSCAHGHERQDQCIDLTMRPCEQSPKPRAERTRHRRLQDRRRQHGRDSGDEQDEQDKALDARRFDLYERLEALGSSSRLGELQQGRIADAKPSAKPHPDLAAGSVATAPA